MKSDRIFSIFLWLWIFASASASTPALPRSVSPSGEFIIYGDDSSSRGAISSGAEAIKSNLLSLLHRGDSWTAPIVINLQSPAANLPELPTSALRISRTESSLKLQLDLAIARGVDSARIERELLRAILMEMIYRKQSAIAVGQISIEPPAWLIEGLLASLPNRDRTSIVNALRAIGKHTSLAEFLRQKFELLDRDGRILYRAYSFVLIEWLIETDEDRARFGRYIDNLGVASDDPLAELQSVFPELAGKNFEKDWESRIVVLQKSNDLLTFPETEKQLADLLGTKFPDASARDASVLDLCQRRPDRSQQLALRKFSEQLMLFAARANPVLRPLVQEYQQLAARLALGKSSGISGRLAELEKLQRRLSARMTEVDDYMNWFEATQLNTPSGLFEDCLKSPTEMRDPASQRKDALSTYLNAVEQQN